MLDEKVNAFKLMLVGNFDDNGSHGFYTLKYHLSDHSFKDLRSMVLLSIFYSSPYEYFNVHSKHCSRESL